MPSNEKGKEQLLKKRYLAIGYGDDLDKKEEGKDITEEDWLLKE